MSRLDPNRARDLLEHAGRIQEMEVSLPPKPTCGAGAFPSRQYARTDEGDRERTSTVTRNLIHHDDHVSIAHSLSHHKDREHATGDAMTQP